MSSDPLASIEVVLINRDCRDAALDPKMDFDRYRSTRDEKLILESKGAKAARFRLTKVAKPFLADVIDAMNSASSKHTMAFLAGCHSYTDAAGAKQSAELHDGAYEQKIAPPEWMTQVAEEFGMEAIYEIGKAVHARASCPKARAPRYV